MAQLTIGTYAETLNPRWMGDFKERMTLVPGGAKLDADAFPLLNDVVVTVGAAGALAAATSVPVDALSGAIPSGTLLDFGTNKFARLTANAAKGATSITVAAIPTALVDNDTATYYPTDPATTYIPSGTLVGRTFTERGTGDPFGPWASGDDEVYLVAYDVYDASVNNDVDLYRHGAVVKENFLPDWANWTSGMKTALRAAYTTTIGAA